MKTINLLLRIRIRGLVGRLTRSTRESQKKKMGAGTIVLLAVLGAFLFLTFSSMFFALFMSLLFSLRAADIDLSFYFAATGALVLLLCLFGSVTATQSELYGSRDNELLLSMPIPPSSILISRMLLLVLLNYLFALVVSLPSFVCYLWLGEATLPGVLLFAFFLFFLPLVALAVSCLIGWLISLISSRMKHKNVISLICAILFMGIYFYVCFGFNAMIERIEADIAGIVSAFSPYLGPFQWMGRAIAHTDLVSGLGFFLLGGVLIAAAYWFLARTYTAILTAGRSGVRYEYREKQARTSSRLGALIRREFLHFISNYYYILNEALGLFLAPAAAIYILIQGKNIGQLMDELPELAPFLASMPVLCAGALCFIGSMTIISAPSVSLEGKNLWIVKSLPVRPGDVLCAKAYMHILVALPFYLVSSILILIGTAGYASLGILEIVSVILLPFAFNSLCAFLGVTLNLRYPRFDYVSENAALKSGASVVLTMFIMMFVSFFSIGVPIMAMLIGIPPALTALVLSLLYLLFSYLLRQYLYNAGSARFSRL